MTDKKTRIVSNLLSLMLGAGIGAGCYRAIRSYIRQQFIYSGYIRKPGKLCAELLDLCGADAADRGELRDPHGYSKNRQRKFSAL